MVRAILAGTKTQTRRIVKPQPDTRPGMDCTRLVFKDRKGAPLLDEALEATEPVLYRSLCPYGMPAPVSFRPIASTGGAYVAGDDGRIYRGGSPLKPWRGGYEQGYEMVSAGEQRKAYVHRLVCEAFYGPAPEGLTEVRHLDGDSLNNRPENLDWGTKEQNAADRSAHGRASREAHPAGKLTEAAIAEIHALRHSMTRPALAARFGVAKGTVDDVLDGRTWIARTAPPPNLPRYQRQPGDRLWVREAHWWFKDEPDHSCGYYPPKLTAEDVEYRADGDDGRKVWRPSIHMPRWASRITLEITGVRVERLQAISDEDAKAEGAEPREPVTASGIYIPGQYRLGFRDLWESINGPGSWDANPWVWVVEFKRVQP